MRNNTTPDATMFQALNAKYIITFSITIEPAGQEANVFVCD